MFVVVCLWLLSSCEARGSAPLGGALGVATALRHKPALVGVGGYNCAGWQCHTNKTTLGVFCECDCTGFFALAKKGVALVILESSEITSTELRSLTLLFAKPTAIRKNEPTEDCCTI